MSDTVKVIYKGQEKEYQCPVSYGDIAIEHEADYADDIVLARVGGELKELNKLVVRDCQVSFVTTKEKNGKRTYRRSVIMLMQRALDGIEEGLSSNLHVHFSLGQGYYCEIYDRKIDSAFLLTLKIEMMRLCDMDLPFTKKTCSVNSAIEFFRAAGLKDKEKLLKYRRSSSVNLYELDGTVDYYFGYMVKSTGVLKYFDIIPYENGFLLQFPNENTTVVAPFEDRSKLFNTLYTSSQWGMRLGNDTVGALNDTISSGGIRDIILMQEAYMEENIGRIAAQIVEKGTCKFVMIAGPSSSGKTTFSHRLSNQLRARGVNPHPIPLDDFYKNRSECPKDENGNYDFERLDALNVELFNACMTALLRGEEVYLPSFNFKTGLSELRQQPMKLGDNDILVIEGIHGLNDELSYALPKESKFKIYISALTQLSIDEHNPLPTTDGRIIRRMVRDARTRNTSAEATLAMWDSVRRGEENYIFPFQEQADVMFNSALLYELAVLKIYAEPLLFAISKESPQYAEAKRLLKLLDYFLPIPPEDISNTSIVREFVGGSIFPV